MKKDEILEKEKDIIIARLKAASSNLYFIDGGANHSYSRDEMLDLINKNTDEGIEFIKTEIEILRAFKDGGLSKLITP